MEEGAGKRCPTMEEGARKQCLTMEEGAGKRCPTTEEGAGKRCSERVLLEGRKTFEFSEVTTQETSGFRVHATPARNYSHESRTAVH